MAFLVRCRVRGLFGLADYRTISRPRAMIYAEPILYSPITDVALPDSSEHNVFS